MGIPTLVRWHLYIETAPCFQGTLLKIPNEWKHQWWDPFPKYNNFHPQTLFMCQCVYTENIRKLQFPNTPSVPQISWWKPLGKKLHSCPLNTINLFTLTQSGIVTQYHVRYLGPHSHRYSNVFFAKQERSHYMREFLINTDILCVTCYKWKKCFKATNILSSDSFH